MMTELRTFDCVQKKAFGRLAILAWGKSSPPLRWVASVVQRWPKHSGICGGKFGLRHSLPNGNHFGHQFIQFIGSLVRRHSRQRGALKHVPTIDPDASGYGALPSP